ncbi:MAG: hypothetical protein GY771_13020 [bacterium]|nr:hypothetical protein [bacterium]
MDNTKICISLIILSLFVSGCAYDGPPVYAMRGTHPWQTLRASEDPEYKPGDVVVVRGSWREGGTPGGSIRVLSVGEPDVIDDILLAGYPITERVFYLNKTIEVPGGFLEGTGLITGDDLYAYGYVVDNETELPADFPETDADVIFADIEAMASRVREVNLDDITSSMHHELNEGYRIKANPAAAEIRVAGRDFERGLTIYEAFLEQLPPYEDPRWYRTLDLFMVYDDNTGLQFGVVCVGGYFLE